ncbi:MAG: hypothetical protein ACF8GE_11820 [Phycisphaerales bacterium JB043]
MDHLRWFYVALSLAVGGASHASVVGMDSRFHASGSLSTGESVQAWHLYVVFDEPATILNIFDADIVFGGTLYQTGAPFGGDTPPNSGFFGFDPDLQWDTYVSIGVMDSTVSDDTTTDPDFAFGSNTISGGWFDANPATPDGATDGTFPAEVFVGQVSVVGSARGLGGSIRSIGVTYRDAAGAIVQEIVWWPTPGTGFALLAGLGLASRRRR